MNDAAIFESELSAFTLPASLDRPLPLRAADLAAFDWESRRLDDSLDALDVLALNAVDAEAAMLFAESPSASASVCTPTSSCSSRSRGRASPKTQHVHHSKKASRKQVHELQVMVNAMQVQVDGAAVEIQQLAQLVRQIAWQREQEQQQQRQLFEQHEMDMDLDAQQRHLQAQVEHDREQFECQQMQRRHESLRL